jgi:hypothetical protein
MQSLIEEIRATGLSDEQIFTSIKVIQDFLSEHYPILATLSEATIFKEAIEKMNIEPR